MKLSCWTTCVGLAGIVVATTTLSAQQVTSEDVVSACADAMGGQAAIDNVSTIRLTYQLPDHGGPATLEIRRPNLLRVGDLVFDGDRAAFLARQPLADGTPRPAELVPSEEWKDFEMEVGWFFPVFFDFPSEYGGIEVIDGIETHRLDVHLPLGARLTYFIDTATHLPLMLESFVTVRGRKSRYVRRFGDYRETGGILYPQTFTYYSHHVREMFTVPIEELELNVPMEDGRFAIPAGLNEPK
ncbi:hypothetical protein ACFL3B_00560 [Gemmatimonadota bacterium]